MKITEIKAQVKIAGRFSVFLDGKYGFSLSDTALLEHRLHIGQELSEEQVIKLKQASIDDKLYGATLRFVGLRPRSEWEIRSYLHRKHASPALESVILNKLRNNGVINDAAFARAWVEHRRLLRPSSKRKLQQELRAKHVSDEEINQVLAGELTDDRQQLRDLATKKRTRYADDMKLMQYLVRQGFNYEDVKIVMSEL